MLLDGLGEQGTGEQADEEDLAALQLLVRAVRHMEDADFALAVLGVKDDEGPSAHSNLSDPNPNPCPNPCPCPNPRPRPDLTWPLTLALGLSALHMLVKAGHLAGAALLLGAGADPNQRAAPARDEYTSGQRGARGG